MWKQLQYDASSPMIFTSGLFLFLFLAFICIYYKLRNTTALRIFFVTLFSYFFYYKSSGTHFMVLALVTVCDWHIANRIYKLQTCFGHRERNVNRWRAQQKWLIALSLVVDLGMLAYYKYTNFFFDCIGMITGSEPLTFDILLPVGISFFTFQSLSYTIDVYRGQLKPLKRLMDYAFYVSFFPQLVAGPIVRARDFIPQIRRRVFVSDEMITRAVFLIMAGVFKKAVISDYISVNFVERVFDDPGLYSGAENLMALYGYGVQIYCDFSGYSDMAIGIALLLGFHFPVNFDSPYKSGSIAEFWRRWHISLSTWLKDYLYISLGGNRAGKIRTYLNLFLTMLIGGLWHGASLNFVFWGALHGMALCVNRGYRQFLGRGRDYRGNWLMRLLGVLLTFHFVTFTWVFFRNTSFETAEVMMNQLFCDFHPELFLEVITGYAGVMTLVALGFAFHLMPTKVSVMWQDCIGRLPLVGKALLICIVAYIVVQVKSSDIQPFIYFQF